MRIAYFDPFSGASGDMILGAMLDAGLAIDALRDGLSGLGLDGYELVGERVSRHSIVGTKATVRVAPDQHARDWGQIRELIGASALADEPKATALAIFEQLATAEAAVHGSPVDHVHFHEVGAVDAIVDICGAAVGLALLGIEHVYSGPPRIGAGWAKTQHGLMPVPAPATARLLAMANAPIAPPHPILDATQAEVLTPTGAAVLTTLATFHRPAFAPSAIGYGFGDMDLPWPNALRLWIGELARPT